MNEFDLSFSESEKVGNGVYYYNFRGSTNSESSPYEVTFPEGFYIFELWGASGGGVYGGKGGYSVGKIGFNQSTELFLYVGGQGINNPSTTEKCLPGGWNGGGKACAAQYQCSGGGGTDIRFTKNDEYLNRIIIAGGGGGAPDGQSTLEYQYTGGCGGGVIGGPSYGYSGSNGFQYGQLYSLGGTQEGPGESIIKSRTYTNTNGSYGIGGDCAGGLWYCGSGGGGLYGGGGGFDVTGGGGGSGFISSLFHESFLLNGNQTFPGKTETEKGHSGHGGIRITVITASYSHQCSLFCDKNFHFPTLILCIFTQFLIIPFNIWKVHQTSM